MRGGTREPARAQTFEADIRAKTEGIRTIAHEIARAVPREDIGLYREKLETRIRDTLQGQNNAEIDENRILTEVAIFADRACIDEELVRLESHFAAMDEMLAFRRACGTSAPTASCRR